MKHLFLVVALIMGTFFYGFKTKVPLKETSPEQNYQQFCASCHGKDMRGGNAQGFMDGVWQFGEGENYMFRNIKFGIPHLGMPSYEESIPDEEIRALVEYIRQQASEKAEPLQLVMDKLETREYTMRAEVVADGLSIPWGIAFIDENNMLITERPGNLRVIKDGLLLETPVKGTPAVLHQGQGGLLDVEVDPDYTNNGWVYLAYSHALEDEKQIREPVMTRIVRGKIINHEWANQEVLFEAPHQTYRTARHHYGCRIVFDDDGYMYFSIGDRGAQDQAQDLSFPNGKVHRLWPDGLVPEDNPFVDNEHALPSIFSYGNRNPQGLAIHPETDELWSTEHGPLGGDELNLIEKGKNYGWPVITYGRNYNGTIISDKTVQEGMEQPVFYWNPSIAVCGLDFYRGAQFEKWQNKLLVGALKYEEVRLLDIKDGRVIHEEVILKNLGRVRDVAAGPEGAVYVVLNNPDRVVKLIAVNEKY